MDFAYIFSSVSSWKVKSGEVEKKAERISRRVEGNFYFLSTLDSTRKYVLQNLKNSSHRGHAL